MAVACLLLSACKGGGEKAIEEITCQGDTVSVNATSPILSRIRTGVIKPEPFSSEFRTVGTVRAETGKYAEVGVPFDGRITEAKTMLGSSVRSGQTLFEVSSPDFFEASKLYFQNLRKYETAKSSYERKKALQDAGVVSLKDLEDAFTEAENAYQEKAASEAVFTAYGIDPVNMAPGQPMKIVAPISGEVVRCNITPGAYIKSDDESVVTIADLRKVWISAQVKERFIGTVRKGGKVKVYSEADPDNPISGTILNVGNLVDEQTRSIQVIVSCDNTDLTFKYGMYVSVHFLSEPREAILVPSTAVFQGEKMSYVYIVSETENTFLRREVIVGEEDADNARVSILEGLRPGETIVCEGGLYLND